MLSSQNSSQTLFFSASDMAKWLADYGVEQAIVGVLRFLQEDFLRWPEFEKAARVASHSKVGVIELMPISDAEQYAFKYVNGHPYNYRLGLPTVMAFGVLSDMQTGVPVFVSELTLATALRTAATSVMAAQLLAKPNSKSMAVIGNGAQSEFQILAFAHLMGIQRFHLYDCDEQATARLQRNLQPYGLDLRVFASTRLAVKGADIVTTITADKTSATILTPDMIECGMHLNAVGGDCPGKTELHPEILERARVFVEYEPQTRVEGEIQQMPLTFPVFPLWAVLAKQFVGRHSNREITVFDSVGFALEDFSTLRFLRHQAIAHDLGHTIDLIPALDDPKDLYGLIHSSQIIY